MVVTPKLLNGFIGRLSVGLSFVPPWPSRSGFVVDGPKAFGFSTLRIIILGLLGELFVLTPTSSRLSRGIP